MFDRKSEFQGNNESPLYCDPAKLQKILANKIEDKELNAIADMRLKDGKPLIRVSLDIEAVGKRERNAVYRIAAKR